MPNKRELIEPHKGDKRFVRRDDHGRFHESDDVGRSLAADRRKHAKTVTKPGQGDKGDQKRRGQTASSRGSALRQAGPGRR